MRRVVSVTGAISTLGAMAVGVDTAARAAMGRACQALAREASTRGGPVVRVAVLRDGAEGVVGAGGEAAVARELGTAREPPAPVLAAAAMQSAQVLAAEFSRGVAAAIAGNGVHDAPGHGAER
jgi:hypothetical protein